MRDLIFVSLEDWDEIWRRNQFLCAKLVERNPDLRILFVEPACDVSYAIRTGGLMRLRRDKRHMTEAHSRIICTRSLKLLPNSWTWARKFNEWMQRWHVRRASDRHGFFSPTLWLNAHGAHHMVGMMAEAAVVYDVTDDWTQFPQTMAAAALTRAQDIELCSKADAVIVCSEQLYGLKALHTRKLYLIPNGVDSDHYSAAFNERTVVPEEARGWKFPVIGYTGTIHPDRVDIALVESIARHLPDCTFVFIGPVMLPKPDRQRLDALPNVVVTGPRSYEQIPKYMRTFDICMTPHIRTPFTESLNPIKLWDYLAVGKPIIATPVAGFRGYPDLVYLASSAEAFALAVRQALSEDSSLPDKRRAEAAKHSWDTRVEAIETILKSLSPTPGKNNTQACIAYDNI